MKFRACDLQRNHPLALRRPRKRRGRRSSFSRRLLVEKLECRELFDSAWHNELRARDVNDDGLVTPLDVLSVFNALTAKKLIDSFGRLPAVNGDQRPPPYVDVNNDGFLSPADALIVLNAFGLDRTGPTVGFEFEEDAASPAVLFSEMPVIVGLASDDLTGVTYLWASIDGGARKPVPIGTDGRFRFATEAIGNDFTDGDHRIDLFAYDVVGNQTSATPLVFTLDRTKPEVAWSIPDNEVDVFPRPWVEAQFSEPVFVRGAAEDAREFSGPGLIELHAADQTVDGTVILDESRTKLWFFPDEDLRGGREFTLHVGEKIRDLAGNTIEFNESRFATRSRAPRLDHEIRGSAHNFPAGSRAVAVNVPELVPATLSPSGTFVFPDAPSGPVLLEFQVPDVGGDAGGFSRTGIFTWYNPNGSEPFLWAFDETFPTVENVPLKENEPTVIINESQLPGWSMRVPASSVRRVDGGNANQMRMLRVPNHLLPGDSPRVMDENIAVFVDVAGGDAAFLNPAEIVAPNYGEFAAGEKLYLWAFDPTRGEWSAVAEAKVSEGEDTIRTLAGQGARHTGLYIFLPERQASISVRTPSYEDARLGRVYFRAQFDNGGVKTGWSDSGSSFEFMVPSVAQSAVIEAAEPLRGLYGRQEVQLATDSTIAISKLDLARVASLEPGVNALDPRISAVLEAQNMPRDQLLDPTQEFDPWGQGVPLKKPVTLDVEVVEISVEDGFAYAASGASGLQVVDVTRPAQPVLISKTGLDAPAIGVVSRGERVAVRLESGDVHVFDVSNPRSPRAINEFLGRQASAIALHGDILVIASGSSVETYNTITGDQIHRVSIEWAHAIDDLAVIGESLHVLHRSPIGYTIATYLFDGTETLATGFLTHVHHAVFDGLSPFDIHSRSGKLSGNDYELLAVDSRGFINTSRDYRAFVQHQLLTGPVSIEILEAPAHDVSQDGTGNAAFVLDEGTRLEFRLTTLARSYGGGGFQWQPSATSETFKSLALAAGMAYAGSPLTIVPHFRHSPSLIEFRRPEISVSGTSWTTEQATASIHARVASAGETAYVALVHEGKVVASDASVPYDLDFSFPGSITASDVFHVTVQVVSNAGNVNNYPIEFSIHGAPSDVATDVVAPAIAASDPSSGSSHWQVDAINIRFTEPIDFTKFALDAASLIEPGADQQFGTADDIAKAFANFNLASSDLLRLSPGGSIAPGKYQVRLDPNQIVDRAGNAASGPLTFGFAVASLIDANAELGTPGAPDFASANVGQVVGVTFLGAGNSTRINFPVRDQNGRLAFVEIAPFRTDTDQAYFRVPANATTGSVSVTGVDDSFYLQIVPTLTSVSGGEVWRLTGSGFVEHGMQVRIADVVVQEYEPNEADEGLGRVLFEALTTPANELSMSGPLTVATSGGVSNPIARPGRLLGISATAESGIPANSDLPSANPGQLIQLQGEGFTVDTQIHIPVVQPDGRASRVLLLRPLSVNEAGTEMTIEVPMQAETGFIGLIGADTEQAIFLQVVPVLRAVNASPFPQYPGQPLRVAFQGSMLPNRTKYHFGEATIVDDDNFENRDVEFRTYDNVALVRLPIEQDYAGEITIETAGGMSAPLRTTFDHIESTALIGTPADPAIASANPGQAVVLDGNGFSTETVVVAEFRTADGTLAASVLDNISATPDGTRLVVALPEYVNGAFPLRILGAENSPRLQIVPTLNRIVGNWGKVRLDGSGFLEGNASAYSVNEATVLDELTDDFLIDVETQATTSYEPNKSVLITVVSSFKGSVSVSTIGGTSNTLTSELINPHIQGLLDIAADGSYAITSDEIYRVNTKSGTTELIRKSSDDYNNKGIQWVSTEFQLGQSTISAGSLLVLRTPENCFGPSCPASIVQTIDPSNGAVLGELSLSQVAPEFIRFSDAAYHPAEESLYILAEQWLYRVNAVTGERTGEWELPTNTFEAIEVDPQTQNLWIAHSNLIEMTPQGTIVQAIDLQSMGGVPHVSGLGIADDGRLWAVHARTISPIDLTPARPGPAVLDRIESVAFAGIPHSDSLASANVAQPIELVGTNFTSKTRVRFPARSREGDRYFETVTPTVIRPDGTRMQVIVPDRSETGDVTILPEADIPHWGLVNDKSYSVYRQIAIPFRSMDSAARFTFQTHGLTASWGLDNVRIVSAEEPDEALVNEDFEAGATLHWKYPNTNSEGRGYLTQFLGPLANHDQSLIVTVNPDQNYVLVFDFYAIDPVMDDLLPSIPGDVFTVSLNDELLYRHPHSGPDPIEGELIQAADSGRVMLQIVPTISKVSNLNEDQGANFVLHGTGFIEGEMRLDVGGVSFLEQFPDPSDSFQTFPPLQYFVDGDVEVIGDSAVGQYMGRRPSRMVTPFTVTTAGGSFQTSELQPSYYDPKVDLLSLDAIAERGVPANMEHASANIGQTITLHGKNLAYATVLFEGVSDAGVAGLIPVFVPQESLGANKALVTVPAGAKTGMLRVFGDDETRIPLQIVPTIESISYSGKSALIEGSGFAVGSTTVQLGEHVVSLTETRPNGSLLQVSHITAPAEIDSDVITVTNEGGRFTLTTPIDDDPDTSPSPKLVGIAATANSGTARWEDMPSAIEGQTVTLYGEGLTSDMSVLFSSERSPGFISVAPLEASPDGNWIQVDVPPGAISGGVRLAGETFGRFLQIVPTVERFQWDDSAAFGRLPAVINGTGFVRRANTIHVGETKFSESSSPSEWYQSSSNLRIPWPKGLPVGPMRIETLGGFSTPLAATLSQIEGTAEYGSPAAHDKASANTGQTIKITGRGLHDRSAIRFPGAAEVIVNPTQVISESEIEVVVPASAETGYISLVGDKTGTGLFLQIVPKIERISLYSFGSTPHELILVGRGFGSTPPVAYSFGEITGYARERDPSNQQPLMFPGSVRIPLSGDTLPSDGVTLTTVGGSFTFKATIDAVEATAASGAPRELSLPSANPEQRISIRGKNFDSGTQVFFRFADSAGFPQWRASEISVDTTGTILEVIVPRQANGIADVVVPGAEAKRLQIVPVIHELEMNSIRTSIRGRGFSEGAHTLYRFNDTEIVDHRADASIDVYHDSFDSYATLDNPVFGSGGFLTVETSGGTSVPWPIDFTSTGMALGGIADGSYVVVDGESIEQIDLQTGRSIASFTATELGLPSVSNVYRLTEEIRSFAGVPIPRGSLLISSFDWLNRRTEIIAFDPINRQVLGRKKLESLWTGPFLGYDSGQNRILVLGWDDIFELDPDTGSESYSTRFSNVSVYGSIMAVHPDTGNLWISRSNELVEYDQESAFIRRIEIVIPGSRFGGITGLAFGADGRAQLSTGSGIIFHVDIPVSNAESIGNHFLNPVGEGEGHDLALIEILDETLDEVLRCSLVN